MKNFVKKTLKLASVCSLVMMFIGTTWAHDEDQRVTIESDMSSVLSAGQINYKFQLIDEKNKTEVKPENLIETHTKIIHLVGYDTAKQEFFHEHPEYQAGQWIVNLNFVKNGSYYVFVQGMLEDGTEFSSYIKLQITNGLPANEILPLIENRTAYVESAKIEFDSQKLVARKLALIKFKISRTDGKPAEITPYLGTNAHVIAVTPDNDEIVHVHPMSGNYDSSGSIHAMFPMPGLYRVWVQAIESGVLRTFSLVFAVQAK